MSSTKRKHNSTEEEIENEFDSIRKLLSSDDRKAGLKKLISVAKSISKSALLKLIGFSSLKKEDAKNILDVDLDNCGSMAIAQFENIILQYTFKDGVKQIHLDDLTEVQIKKIIEGLEITAIANSCFWNGGNEATREKFIYKIFEFIVYFIKKAGKCKEGSQNNFRLVSEQNIKSDDSDYHGPVEFVVMYRQLYLCITEAKQDDFVQGMVQNLFQLYTAYLSNEQEFPVFGCVTNAEFYQFILYDGKEFIITEKIQLSTVHTVDKKKNMNLDEAKIYQSLTPIANIIYHILQLELYRASPTNSHQLLPTIVT